MLQVELNPGLKGGRWACLRPLCGHDEASINGVSAIESAVLIDRLLVSVPGTTVTAGSAEKLAVCDCDRIFAALYLNYFGEQVESTVSCQTCGDSFELAFSLRNLMANLDAITPTKATGPDSDGIYTLEDGRQFRLPTLSDRNALIGLEPESAITTLLKRCMVHGDPMAGIDSLQAAMEEVGPVLDLDLDAQCPHCSTDQTVRFDIQTYMLRALIFEQRFLTREIHRIAMAYGWGHQEILNLPREERQTFVRLIEAEARGQRRRRL